MDRENARQHEASAAARGPGRRSIAIQRAARATRPFLRREICAELVRTRCRRAQRRAARRTASPPARPTGSMRPTPPGSPGRTTWRLAGSYGIIITRTYSLRVHHLNEHFKFNETCRRENIARTDRSARDKVVDAAAGQTSGSSSRAGQRNNGSGEKRWPPETRAAARCWWPRSPGSGRRTRCETASHPQLLRHEQPPDVVRCPRSPGSGRRTRCETASCGNKESVSARQSIAERARR